MSAMGKWVIKPGGRLRVEDTRRPGARDHPQPDGDDQIGKPEHVPDDATAPAARCVDTARNPGCGDTDQDVANAGGQRPERGHLAAHHQPQEDSPNESPQVEADQAALPGQQTAQGRRGGQARREGKEPRPG